MRDAALVHGAPCTCWRIGISQRDGGTGSLGAYAALVSVAPPEDHALWEAWAEAWLREYRCHARYLSLLALDAAEECELRYAWLEWWSATCDCRDASRRLDEL